MAKLFNRAKMTTSTTGSGTVTLGSASFGYQTFAAAGVSDGDVVQYVIEEGGNFEIGTGTYSATGTSLTRSVTESSNAGSAITLSGSANVSITAVADDLNRLQYAGSTKVEPTSSGATVTGDLAVTGTVDGRDVATDGTKLDGIESGATADQSASEIKTAYESNSDTNAFTDALQTKLNGIEAAADVTDAANVEPLVDAHINVSGASSGQYLGWNGSDYAWSTVDLTTKVSKSGDTMTGALTGTSFLASPTAVSVTGAATTLDFSGSDNFVVTMGASTTFTFSNVTAGQTGVIYIKEDATGGYSFTLPAIAKTPVGGASIVQTTTANSISVLSYTVLDTSNVLVNYIGDFA